jgi:hypothetical protein
MKKLTFFLLFLCAMAHSFAANKYWVGGLAGTWAATTSWSDISSAGASGATAPTTGDDVFFENGVATVTLGAAVTGINSITFTSINVTFAGAFAITTNSMTAASSQITFVDHITINTALTFSGTDPRITNNASTNGKAVTLGNGGAFTLTGNSTTNYFTGNSNAYFTYNTTSPLTVYFDPTTITAGNITVTRGLITLGNSVMTIRLTLSATNSQELILGNNVTLTLTSVSADSNFTNLANGGVVNASASGSKFTIIHIKASVLDGSSRIFKTGAVINNFEFKRTGSTFNLYESIRVRNITKTAGTIATTALKTITVEAGGSITGAGSIGTDIIYESTRFWVGGTAGNWSVAANWGTSPGSTSTPGIPAITDYVVFDNSTGNVNPTVTLTTNVTAEDIKFTSTNVTFAGPYAITTNSMTLTSSLIAFVNNVTINSALTFSGTISTITSTTGNNSLGLNIGNGDAFTLTGHTSTSTIGGNAIISFNTSSALTAYLSSTTLQSLQVLKGLITLGNSVNTIRLSLAQNNNQELIIGASKTLTLSGTTGCLFSLLSNSAGGAVNASAAGSKFLITNTNTSVITATSKRIFKENSTINNLEFGYTTSTTTFTLKQPIRVRTIKTSAFTAITNTSPNTITKAPDGSVTGTGTIANAVITGTALSRYWVGSTAGNWSLASNWGISIGSATTPGIPEYADDVVVSKDALVTIDQLSTINSLTVAAGGKVTNTSTLNASTLTLNSNDVDGTSTFIDNGTSTITNAIANQYLGTTRNWYISSPVVSTASSTSNIASYYEYVEAGNNDPSGQPTNSTVFWKGYTPGATFMTAGKGYIALPNNSLASIQFSGTLNKGNVSIPLTKTGNGFNLIGNPYPSHLTWTKVFVDAITAPDGGTAPVSLIEPTIWYRTNAGEVNSGVGADWSFKTINASTGEASPIGTTNIIPPMQAFWVKAKVAGNLILTSDLTKSHNTSNRLKAPAAKNTDRQRVRLEVSNGTRTDETLIYFDAAASDSYDRFDSPKYSESNSKTQIFTTVGTEKLVINGMNSIVLDTPIPIGLVEGTASSFSIKANELSNIPVGVKVILKDNATLVETDLTDGTAMYSFEPAVVSGSRFSLHFRAPGVATGVNTSSKLNAQVFLNSANQITIVSSEKCNYAIYNVMGQKQYENMLSSTKTTINRAFGAGIYLVELLVNGQSEIQKVIIR